MRRTKSEMEAMKNFIRLDLLANNNDPHKAFEAMVKEHLVSGQSIPYYIKGIKDYVTVSQELTMEMERIKSKQQLNNKYKDIEATLKNLSVDEYKIIYREYKDKVSHNEKLILHDLYMMIWHNDFKGFGIHHINVFTMYNIELPKSA